MAKQQTGIVRIRDKDYKTVALRVAEFRDNCLPKDGWAITTEIIDRTEEYVIVKAEILNASRDVVATGLAEEYRKSSQINKTSALENCETSAIGRALAAFGLGGSEYASANEVQNAIHQQGTRRSPPPLCAADQEQLDKGAKAIAEQTTMADLKGFGLALKNKSNDISPAVMEELRKLYKARELELQEQANGNS